MEYVKGHSGDKQNDRVDKIATNYSKGVSILSNLKTAESSVDFFKKNAPAEIQELFSRNEFCLLYTSPSPRDLSTSRMPSSA